MAWKFLQNFMFKDGLKWSIFLNCSWDGFTNLVFTNPELSICYCVCFFQNFLGFCKNFGIWINFGLETKIGFEEIKISSKFGGQKSGFVKARFENYLMSRSFNMKYKTHEAVEKKKILSIVEKMSYFCFFKIFNLQNILYSVKPYFDLKTF